MALLLGILCPFILIVGVYGGYLIRTAEMRDELPKLEPKARVLSINGRARNGSTWLLLGGDGEMCEGRWVTPRRAARVFGGKPSDYASTWIGWDDEEIHFQPVAYTEPLKLPVQP